MNDEQENFDSYWGLSSWEQTVLDEIEKTPDTDIELQNAKDLAVQKLWYLFQNAATGIAQLYKDRQTGVSLWVPFQAAASSVTSLYKECIESHKPVYDLGYQSAIHKRNKEILSWAKKKKRHIRREELIAMVTGKSLPASRGFCPRPRLMLEGVHSGAHPHRFNPSDAAGLFAPRAGEDFDMFREALTFSTNLRQHNPSSPTSLSRVRARHCNSTTSTPHNELSAFITEELSRHSRKRSPSLDVIMDSPTHKRSRYWNE